MDQESLEQLIHEIDKDGDGKIDYFEVCALMFQRAPARSYCFSLILWHGSRVATNVLTRGWHAVLFNDAEPTGRTCWRTAW